MKLALIILILATLACGSTQATQQPEVPAQGQPGEKGAPATYKIGDAITTGSWMMTVNEVTYLEGSDIFKPKDGNRFVIVDVTFENKGSQQENISTLLQMELKDDTGQKYNLDISAISASGGASPDGQVAAGDKLRGQAGYQVPIEATGLTFSFTGNPIGGEKITVHLD